MGRVYTLPTVHCRLSDHATLSPTKYTVLLSDVLYYNVLLIDPTCLDPSWDHHQGLTLK
jgi:hypothetical protein